MRGNIRTSDFNAVPTVRKGSTWEQTHGLFGGPPTVLPCSRRPDLEVRRARGARAGGQSQLRAGLASVGNAAATALQNSHGRLASEVQGPANG